MDCSQGLDFPDLVGLVIMSPAKFVEVEPVFLCQISVPDKDEPAIKSVFISPETIYQMCDLALEKDVLRPCLGVDDLKNLPQLIAESQLYDDGISISVKLPKGIGFTTLDTILKTEQTRTPTLVLVPHGEEAYLCIGLAGDIATKPLPLSNNEEWIALDTINEYENQVRKPKEDCVTEIFHGLLRFKPDAKEKIADLRDYADLCYKHLWFSSDVNMAIEDPKLFGGRRPVFMCYVHFDPYHEPYLKEVFIQPETIKESYERITLSGQSITGCSRNDLELWPELIENALLIVRDPDSKGDLLVLVGKRLGEYNYVLRLQVYRTYDNHPYDYICTGVVPENKLPSFLSHENIEHLAKTKKASRYRHPIKRGLLYENRNCSPSGIVTYPAIFSYEDGQEISVVFPDLDVGTSGVDNADALSSARECLEVALRGLQEDGIRFPAPSRHEDVRASVSESECIYNINAAVY